MIDQRFVAMKNNMPSGEPGDWSMAWKLRALAVSFQVGDLGSHWPDGDGVQIDLLDTADWIEEAARRLSDG